jgi:putative lipoprotein
VRVLVLCLTLSGATAFAQQRDPDPWLGPDKALHCSLSAAIAGVGYTGAAFLTDDVRLRLLAGGGLALVAGTVKELADLAGLGTPSWKDFTWDVIGTAAGLLTSWLLDHFVITPLQKASLLPSP